jgi:thiol-disulfide isomerase/thioredoxin
VATKKPPAKRPSGGRPSGGRPNRAPARRGRPAGLFTWLAVGLVVAVGLAFVIIKETSGSSTPPSSSSSWQAASPTIVHQVTHVPASVFNAVGVTSPVAPASPPQAEKNLPVLDATNASGQKVPVVLYMGGEFCPYCAAERWSIIVALSRFGTFSDLGNMSSYANDVYPNTPTFTFLKANYTSKYLVFEHVELYANYLNKAKTYYATLQKPTKQEKHEIDTYDTEKYITGLTPSTATSIPFLSYANKFLSSGASYSPSTLAGSTRAQIAAGLSNPTSPITQAIIASANYKTATICTLTNQQPSNVCSSSGVMTAAKAMGIK